MGSYSPDWSPGGTRRAEAEVADLGRAHEPEILPPVGSGASLPVRKRRAMWEVAPATYFLVGVNCLVFVYMLARHVSIMSPTPGQLLHYGANHAGLVLIYGQWWRIVSAMFVHVGIIHLATNMWCLWNLGLLAEPLLGSGGLLAAYILSGAAGNLLSTLINWWMNYGDWMRDHDPGVFSVGAGASGAVFGLAGVLIVLLKSPRLPIPQLELRRLRKSVIYFAAINLIIGIGTLAPGSPVRIDNMAHMGGFGCGLLFAAPLVPRLGSPRSMFESRRRIAVAMIAGLLVLFGFYLSQLPK